MLFIYLYENVYLDFLPNFFIQLFILLILSCLRCLYIFEIYKIYCQDFFFFWDIQDTLLVALFANIFSHSLSCLLILFMVSFVYKNLWILIRSHLFIFVCLFSLFLVVDPKRYGCYLYQRVFCLFCVCVCKSFIVSHFTFRSLIHFEFI